MAINRTTTITIITDSRFSVRLPMPNTTLSWFLKDGKKGPEDPGCPEVIQKTRRASI